ncbi:MAG: hemerythrin family protein [Rhodospirillaceae bacterium]|nr:hemerythrin family protein [Rhodospirillales bacterium]
MGIGDDLKVTWKDGFSVGDELIDEQHRAFFDEVNHVAAQLDGGNPRNAVIQFYRTFFSNLVQHFRDEEALLARIKFSELENHRAEHEALLASVSAFEGLLLTCEDIHELRFVVKRLFVALLEHVVTEDMRYKTFVLRAQGV